MKKRKKDAPVERVETPSFTDPQGSWTGGGCSGCLCADGWGRGAGTGYAPPSRFCSRSRCSRSGFCL